MKYASNLFRFVFGMLKILKYLSVIIVAAAVWSGADSAAEDIPQELLNELSLEYVDCQTIVSEQGSEPCLPRQITTTSVHHVQAGLRKSNNVQKNKFEFVKSGKVMNAGIRIFIQNRSIILNSSRCEPGHILLSQGRLII